MARLGSPRLFHKCSRPWVHKRMTDVSFVNVRKAYQAGCEIKEVFCTEGVLRRLNGNISISTWDVKRNLGTEACLEMIDLTPGKINLNISLDYPLNKYFVEEDECRFVENLLTCIQKSEKIYYLSIDDRILDTAHMFPNLIFCLMFQSDVLYRPEKLNGRSTVTAAKAVNEEVRRISATIDESQYTGPAYTEPLRDDPRFRGTTWCLINMWQPTSTNID